MVSPKKPEGPRGVGATKKKQSGRRQWRAASPRHSPSSPPRSPPSSPAKSPSSTAGAAQASPSPTRASNRPRGVGATKKKRKRSGRRQWRAASPPRSSSSTSRAAQASPSSTARDSPSSRSSNRSGKRQCGEASPTHSPSPPRSPPSSPARPSPSSSARAARALLSSPARASPPSASPPTSALPPQSPEATPVFDIYMDDAQNSLAKAFEGIRGLFTSILKNDHLLEGKLVTKSWGSFMIRMFSSKNSIEDPVCALYRTHDLYLDSVLSNRKWRRFEDHEAILPNEVETEGSVSFDFGSDYKSLGCNPDEANQIKVGNSQARDLHMILRRLADEGMPSAEDKKALVLFVIFAEALRFPAFERWLLIQIGKEESMYIPLEYTELFRKWGTLSIAFHDGRDNFSKAIEAVKKVCKTYDAVCSLLGIVNRVNLRKKTKATKNQKKLKKKNRKETEEEADSSDNKRRKGRMKKRKH